MYSESFKFNRLFQSKLIERQTVRTPWTTNSNNSITTHVRRQLGSVPRPALPAQRPSSPRLWNRRYRWRSPEYSPQSLDARVTLRQRYRRRTWVHHSAARAKTAWNSAGARQSQSKAAHRSEAPALLGRLSSAMREDWNFFQFQEFHFDYK